MSKININNSSYNLLKKNKTLEQVDLSEQQKDQINAYRKLSDRFGLHPIKYDTKHPKDDGWEKFCVEKRSFREDDFIHTLPNGRITILNAGIACGPENGIIVLDIDSNDFDKYCEENNIELPLPDTLTIASGGKSLHYYFEYPSDGKVYGNRSKKGIFDIRGLGGQVIAPGSIHYETSDPYTIRKDVAIAEPPAWLLDLASKPDKEVGEKSRRSDTNQKQDAALISVGQRNVTLASLAGKMHAGGFSYDAILAALEKENANRCSPPLDDKEVKTIVNSITKYPPGKSGSQFHLTELGNAERLVQKFGNDIRYCPEEKRWYAWNGKKWQ